MALSEIDKYLVLCAKAAQRQESVGRGLDNPRGRANDRRWLRKYGFSHDYPGDQPGDLDRATLSASQAVAVAAPHDSVGDPSVPTTIAAASGRRRRRTNPPAASASAGTTDQTITITTRTTTTVATKITLTGWDRPKS